MNDNESSISLIQRMQNLLPDLEFSRETHRQWRDCDQKYRDENPSIGDVKFHEKCIVNYDDRISTIKDTIIFLQENII